MRALIRLSFLLPLLIASSASPVTIDWKSVGNPGNTCDPQSQGCFGAAGYAYMIGTYDVTNAQYAEFLNAVAAADPNALYHTAMGAPNMNGGITRSGSPGSYTYSAKAGRENMPVNWVSFWDALRFVNWLENGQPDGAQGPGTTETGAYTITAQGVSDNSIKRNPGATIVLPTEDEWYKAAYYNAPTSSYFGYPARSSAQIACTAPTAALNSAACNLAAGFEPTNVGSYTGSASPYGTFDQGGNMEQWNETIVNGVNRGSRGGSFIDPATNLAASHRNFAGPTNEDNFFGFRVASLPEPSTDLLRVAGLAGVLAVGGWRRARA